MVSVSGSDWDQHYANDHAPWETGEPSAELRRVVAEDQIEAGRVIDVGCGTGIHAVWLAEQGFAVTGVDISPLAIDKARQRAEAAGVEVDFRVADVLNWQGDDEPFPFFFDRGCYHAVRRVDLQAYLNTLKHLTLPGSLGLILTGNAKDPHEPGQGPPVVSDDELHAELEPVFEILRLREFRFAQLEGPGPLAWSCLVRRSSLHSL